MRISLRAVHVHAAHVVTGMRIGLGRVRHVRHVVARVWVRGRGGRHVRHVMPGVGIGLRRRTAHGVAGMGIGRGLGPGLGLSLGSRRHDVTGVRIGGLGLGGSGGEDERRDRDEKTGHWAAPSRGRTVTTLNIPACMCISRWQWKAQSPGASAVRSKVTLDPGATLTVCFRG